MAGLAAGVIVCFLYFQIYLKLHPRALAKSSTSKTSVVSTLPNKILEIQAVKEYQPLQKYEVSLDTQTQIKFLVYFLCGSIYSDDDETIV